MKQIDKKYILGAVLILVFFFLGFVASRNPDPSVVIQRNGYGEGEKEEILYVDEEPVTILVEEREYTKEEKEEAFKKGFSWMKKQVLSENPSFHEIRTRLVFPEKTPEGLSAEWICENPELILSDGTLCNDDWEEEREEQAAVTLRLYCGEEVQQETYYFLIRGPILTEEQKLIRKITRRLTEMEAETRMQDSILLPAEIDGVRIGTEPPRSAGAWLFFAAAVVLLGIARKNSRKKEEWEKKEHQLKEDYPLLVNKIILYLGAGLNLKNVFEIITKEYQEDRKRKKTAPRHLYENLLVMVGEMNAGMGEREAYEKFGKTMGSQEYRSLMALLIQNRKKGNEGLLDYLWMEEEQAFHKNLDRTRTEGEKTGTKLLLPMILLLGVVMVIVMAPALLQFQTY